MKKVDLVYYPVGKGFLGSLTRAATSVRMYGKERVPREGGGVLAMNHFNFIDVPVFGTFCPRRIVFVGKSELFEIPGLAQLIRAHGTLSIRRGESDRDALRRMRETVRENDLLGLFIEGTRQLSGVPGKPMPGAAMIAISEGVPGDSRLRSTARKHGSSATARRCRSPSASRCASPTIHATRRGTRRPRRRSWPRSSAFGNGSSASTS